MSRIIKTGLLSVWVGFSFTTAIFADHIYTPAELEQKTKSELIDIILSIQSGGGSHGNCQTYNPLTGGKGSILIRRNNPGYGDDGTLTYPNGQVFMLRNAGYNNDRSLFYANGQTMMLQNQGYSNHHTTYWPSGIVQRLRNSGYGNDGTINHSDGTVWLLRNVGYSNDRQRSGPPVESITNYGFTVRASLTSTDSVVSREIITGSGWSLTIAIDGSDDSVQVTECLD